MCVALLSGNTYAVCSDNNVYGKNGNWLGCTLPKNDPMLNSTWLSQVINIYGNDRHEGITHFKIDKNGKYTARTLIRNVNRNCLFYNGVWGSQLYKLDTNTYASWDENGTAYYLIVTSKNKQIASSHLVGGADIFNISERNMFFRMPNSYTMNNILEASKPMMCDTKSDVQ